MPTIEQAFACVRVCQMLSSGFQPIHLFRYNRNTRTVYILAGVTESIEVIVHPNGVWRFKNDEA
ncbi:MAG: hypothetical protein KME11_01625 [Timaviella obliquedivisa GSE-PSE-MK23-08B]|nr:hypothetical protein [Timaviella obliquedivisa GSE-PSE-MK23-08B]